MKNFKWVAVVAAVFVLAGAAFYFGDGGLFKGSTDRGGKGSSSSDRKTSSASTTPTKNDEESDKNAPWWCKKTEIYTWSEEDEGDEGEPNSGSTTKHLVEV